MSWWKRWTALILRRDWVRTISIVALLLPLGGCLTLDEQRQIDETYRFRFYSKSEVDALNARSECRLLARNLVQIARCDGR